MNMKHKAVWLDISDEVALSLSKNQSLCNDVSRSKSVYNLQRYISYNGNISGTALSKALFPTYETGYFISHSHNDGDITQKLSSLLYKRGKTVFYDEMCWSSADELIRTLNEGSGKMQCNCGEDFYDLDACLKNSSLAYVLLCSALQEAISKSHTFIFVGTNHSIYSKNYLTTLSPWLYFELNTINKIIESESIIKLANESITSEIELSLALSKFERVQIQTSADLNDWLNKLQ